MPVEQQVPDIRFAICSSVTADKQLNVQAGNNVSITAGQSRQSVDQAHQKTSKGTLSSTTRIAKDGFEGTTSVGSSLGGNTVTVVAGNSMRVSGSSVLSDAATTLIAKNNLSIEAAQDSRNTTSFRDEKKSGLFSGGGIGITYGVKQQSLDSQTTGATAAASTVGAVGGNVTLQAGNAYRQVGSDVLAVAPTGAQICQQTAKPRQRCAGVA